jgi:hypothetical protein
VSFLSRLLGTDDRDDDDVRLMERLAAAGVDLSRPLDVEHVLTMPDERSARQAVAALANTGGTVQLSPDLLGRRWNVRVMIPMVITLERMTALREQLDAFAGERGGRYAGWGTSGHQP